MISRIGAQKYNKLRGTFMDEMILEFIEKDINTAKETIEELESVQSKILYDIALEKLHTETFVEPAKPLDKATFAELTVPITKNGQLGTATLSKQTILDVYEYATKYMNGGK